MSFSGVSSSDVDKYTAHAKDNVNYYMGCIFNNRNQLQIPAQLYTNKARNTLLTTQQVTNHLIGYLKYWPSG
jgi:hypothetical protein